MHTTPPSSDHGSSSGDSSSRSGRLKSELFTDPAPLSLLPLLYVAWADSELSPEEIEQIDHALQVADIYETSTEERLRAWLDPSDPPTAAQLLTLLMTVRRAAAGRPELERLSLAGLGTQLATLGGREVPAAEREALSVIEEVLGLRDQRFAPRLLGAQRPDSDHPAPVGALPAEDLQRLLARRRPGVRAAVLQVLSRDSFSRPVDVDRETYRRQTLDWCRELAAEGLGALAYPASAGGAGDWEAALIVFETLGFHDFSLQIKFGVQFGLFGGSILQLGSERHHELLAAVGRLDMPGCFAMTETGHGSNVQDLETVARYDSVTDELVLDTPSPDARKDYIGNAARHGRMATVFAQLEVDGERHGVHAVLVPIRREDGEACAGVVIEDCGGKMGLEGVDNGRLTFSGVRVPRGNLLDRFASISDAGVYESPIASPDRRFFTMLGTLVAGRVSVALGALSAAKSALTIAVRYADRRRQFGPGGEAETLLLDYPSHQRRLLPRLATTYALHFALDHLVERYIADAEEDRRAVEVLAAGLKAFSTWHTTDSVQEAREACGGQGYLSVNRFKDLKADTDVFTTFEGDNTVLLQLVAKGLLTGYKQQFSDLNLLGLTRYVAGKTKVVVSELNPVITRRTDEAHLADPEFHVAALKWREDHLLGTVARRLKVRFDRGEDATEVFSTVQTHLLATAKAHIERLVHERFLLVVHDLPEGQLRGALARLCELFALERIERDCGWFLEHGYLEPNKSKAIRKRVERLCAEVRPQAGGLVDAFGIPEELLGAPIASA
ncbi:MAG: acyl-CoA dehydrogenase family protein [Thermoanaerobaculia bacterium]|nr:acyl-CoA dehydrogenase family protein [Thermoanaerobaculia bacterium]